MCRLTRQLFLTLVCAVLCGYLFAQAAAPNEPIRIKVVVVTMFERGEDTGDDPGEFQLWVEREHLDRILPLPYGYHHCATEPGRSARHGHRRRHCQGRCVGNGAGP